MCFHRDPSPLNGFFDADWASDVNGRKSFTGYILKYASGAISWESRKQRTVALSINESCVHDIIREERMLSFTKSLK